MNRPNFSFELWDFVGLAAVAVTLRGLALIYSPAAWIALGLILGAVYVLREMKGVR